MSSSEVPGGWVVGSIDDVASSLGGSTPSKSDPSFWVSGDIPWVSPKDMKAFHIRSSEDAVTEKALARLTKIPENSVLLVVRSGILARTLPVAINTISVTINQDLRAFLPEVGVDPRFLAWQLIADEREILGSCSKDGTTVASIEGPALSAYPLKIAPSLEQQRIVEKLEELLSDLDAGVAELKVAQRKLAQYRQSLLKAAVEGALTADWRAARGTPQETGAELLQRILTERRARWEQRQLAKFAEQGKSPPKGWQAKYREPIAPRANDELSIPSVWVWTGIEQLADGDPHALKAGPFGSALKKEFYTPTGYKVYGQEQVIRGDPYFGDYFISREKYEELISCATRRGDLLISLVGTTGKVLVLPDDAKPGVINPRLLKVSLSPGNVHPAYVKLILESPYARHFFKLNAHGGTMDVLNLGILKELAIPLPELTEQEEIVRMVEDARESIERQATAIDHGLRQCAAQRKNLLKAAFAGQLVPQDPNDEPASELVARIRAERASNNGSAPRRRRKTA